MVPQAVQPQSSTLFPAQDARLLRYKDVLSKMSTNELSTQTTRFPTENTPNTYEGWVWEDDDVEEMKGYKPIKSEGIGPLLGGFADADSAID